MKDASRLMVIALGGNAITEPGGPPGIAHQFVRTAQTAGFLSDLIERGHQLAITHGNGPQVGGILRRVEMAAPQVYPLPLEICVADTQGGMGYMIAQCMSNELARRGRRLSVAALITTVLVDSQDPAFRDPTKPIGKFLDRAEARRREAEGGWTVKEVSKGRYRRVVPSPLPVEILERDSIRHLVDGGHLVVACGGGGVPVDRDSAGDYAGVAAVIDKDLVSALMAIEIEADCLISLTAVERVSINFETPQQTELDHMTVGQARRHLADGQFPPGSMGPKIEAAVQFLERAKSGAEALITSDRCVTAALEGNAGTRITLN